MYRWLLGFVFLLAILTTSDVLAFSPSTTQEKELLAAPQQRSPASNAQVEDSPNHAVKFEWSRVDDAYSYGIEIDCFGCCTKKKWCSVIQNETQTKWKVTSPYTFNFPSRQAGSWRVWAIDKAGHAGKASAWSSFAIASAGKKDSAPRHPDNGPPQPLPQPIVMQSDAQPVDSVTGEPCTPPAKYSRPPDVTLPKGISTPEPEYGELSRRARVNGGATVLIDIGADGLVKRACLFDAIQPDLGEQSVKAARHWRFEPARKGGEPIPFSMMVETEFTIYPWRQGK